MPNLNSNFHNDVHYLDDTGAAGKSLTASFNSSKTYTGMPGLPVGGFALDRGTRYCIQAVWTGTASPVGTFTIQGSNDNVNWTTISNSSVAVNGAGNVMWRDNADYKFVRVVYTATSGGSTDTVLLTIRVSNRSVGG